MRKQEFLGEFEQMVLLAALRRGEGAYAVSILREIEERTRRKVSRGAVYVTLGRLERKGYLESRFADPTPERGGKSKKYVRVSPLGMRCLGQSRKALTSLWEGLSHLIDEI